jgi:aldehyde:ferredoxin oxidoreductase
VAPNLGITYFDKHAAAEKSANVAHHQDWRCVIDSLVMCILTNVPAETVVDLVNAACGLDWGMEDMMRSGERGWNIKRAINHRMGLTRGNDRLPKALLEPFPDGPGAGFVPDIEAMLASYYTARGWDPSTGRPMRAKLISLGLDDVAVEFWGS